MTRHFFENALVRLQYYKFGSGKQAMLCFHGYGMHGKQFKIFEPGLLSSKYTFYGFDLFFHKETKLKDQSIASIKKGISKKELAGLICDFCSHEDIKRFSLMGYSMGSHYATAVVEELPAMVNEYIVAAPSSLNPGILINYFSKNKFGNKVLEKLTVSKNSLLYMLKLGRWLGFLDKVGYKILFKEFETAELRLSFYACFTYLRFLETNKPRLIKVLNEHSIKCIFIFGKHDRMYPSKIGNTFIPELEHAQVLILDEDHEMINQNFATQLTGLLYDN